MACPEYYIPYEYENAIANRSYASAHCWLIHLSVNDIFSKRKKETDIDGNFNNFLLTKLMKINQIHYKVAFLETLMGLKHLVCLTLY